jgi:catalase
MTDQSPDNREVLTNRQGHPVHDNQNQRTIGSRGPATLENYQFLEKMSHFDRERVPERVVHARGTTAFGYFEADGTVGDDPIARYTRANPRVCSQVLHRGRQLGSRRQQPCRLLHS